MYIIQKPTPITVSFKPNKLAIGKHYQPITGSGKPPHYLSEEEFIAGTQGVCFMDLYQGGKIVFHPELNKPNAGAISN